MQSLRTTIKTSIYLFTFSSPLSSGLNSHFETIRRIKAMMQVFGTNVIFRIVIKVSPVENDCWNYSALKIISISVCIFPGKNAWIVFRKSRNIWSWLILNQILGLSNTDLSELIANSPPVFAQLLSRDQNALSIQIMYCTNSTYSSSSLSNLTLHPLQKCTYVYAYAYVQYMYTHTRVPKKQKYWRKPFWLLPSSHKMRSCRFNFFIFFF